MGWQGLRIGLFEPFSELSHLLSVATGCARWLQKCSIPAPAIPYVETVPLPDERDSPGPSTAAVPSFRVPHSVDHSRHDG